MKNKRIVILAILLMLALGTFSRLTGIENISAIQFFSIFAIGLLAGLLLNELGLFFRSKKDN